MACAGGNLTTEVLNTMVCEPMAIMFIWKENAFVLFAYTFANSRYLGRRQGLTVRLANFLTVRGSTRSQAAAIFRIPYIEASMCPTATRVYSIAGPP